MTQQPLVLTQMGMVNALGTSYDQIFDNLMSGNTNGLSAIKYEGLDEVVVLGEVKGELPDLSHAPARFQTRNNQLAKLALNQIKPQIESLCDTFGRNKVAVIIGTSTSGIASGEKYCKELSLQEGTLNKHQVDSSSYEYAMQEMNNPADFIANEFDLTGPTYSISTACSSSAKAFASARRLILSGVVDAAIVGGVDSLCELTPRGFSALESTSSVICQPFSHNRDGINIGEGACLFILQKASSGIALLGVGESSDAHHISAPHPEGVGAISAMLNALEMANKKVTDVDYINLHGTATKLNDLIEGNVVAELFPQQTPCSSTKPLIGHTLGAAGAMEAGFCWMAMSAKNTEMKLPPHCWDGKHDPLIPKLQFVTTTDKIKKMPTLCLSNSFAFGGSNSCVAIGVINND